MADHPATLRTILHSQETDTKSQSQQSQTQVVFLMLLDLRLREEPTIVNRHLELLPCSSLKNRVSGVGGEGSFGHSPQIQLTEPQLASWNYGGAQNSHRG